MLLGLADSLVACRGLNGRHAALSAALWWARPKPPRGEHTGGYSAYTFAKLRLLKEGHDYRALDQEEKTPGGSFGNGGAMRIAPVGVAYRALADAPDRMRAVVAEALRFSHTHAEAVDAATAVALAVARLVAVPDPALCDAAEFARRLEYAAATQELRSRLHAVADHVAACAPQATAEDVDRDVFSAADKQFLEERCWTPGKWFQIRAVDAVATALFMACKYGGMRAPESLQHRCAEMCLVRSIGVGGDTDTVACITGSMLGALHGQAWVPQRWLSTFSLDAEFGLPKAIVLGKRLASLSCTELVQDDIVGQQTYDRMLCELVSLPVPVRHQFT
eukprot:TRINITY_DN3878_c0_g1_i3.p1 TRINITY_DN3878_c0_g1~~TRINITY_DN3878_c0_g1_i3.p1  ORF type:complete len:365 (-),score=89.03 TRINITY_DN3878_c0_g1_i3:16-1017(-)